MLIAGFPAGAWGTNCYLVAPAAGGDALVRVEAGGHDVIHHQLVNRIFLHVRQQKGEPTAVRRRPGARGVGAEIRGHGAAVVVEVVDGDNELLRRAIENVMRNAIRYAPRDSKVEVSLENGNGRAKVRVRDYGPGVPEDALPRLFDPFFRVDSDRNRTSGGAGLGLSIARRAVELHR